MSAPRQQTVRQPAATDTQASSAAHADRCKIHGRTSQGRCVALLSMLQVVCSPACRTRWPPPSGLASPWFLPLPAGATENVACASTLAQSSTLCVANSAPSAVWLPCPASLPLCSTPQHCEAPSTRLHTSPLSISQLSGLQLAYLHNSRLKTSITCFACLLVALGSLHI